MGRRGPKPTPAAILKARGTFRPDRHHDTVKPAGKPTCPKWLTDTDARAEFRRVSKLLLDMGVAGAADGNAITRYCVAWVQWRRLSQALLTNPGAAFQTYKDADGKVKNIQVSAMRSMVRSLGEELSRAEQTLGMTPSSRSRMDVSMPPAPTGAEPTKSKARFFPDAPAMRIAQ